MSSYLFYRIQLIKQQKTDTLLSSLPRALSLSLFRIVLLAAFVFVSLSLSSSTFGDVLFHFVSLFFLVLNII